VFTENQLCINHSIYISILYNKSFIKQMPFLPHA